MNISIDISYYPLKDEFIPHVKGFIQRLNTYKNIQQHLSDAIPKDTSKDTIREYFSGAMTDLIEILGKYDGSEKGLREIAEASSAFHLLMDRLIEDKPNKEELKNILIEKVMSSIKVKEC